MTKMKRPMRPFSGHEPPHPGKMLRDLVMPDLDETVSSAARKLGITRQHLHKIMREEAQVSAEMALRLGKFCGNGPDLWLNMQRSHDLWHAERKLARVIDKIPRAIEKAVVGAHDPNDLRWRSSAERDRA